ncbi:MAG: helix-turn-helix transcriptional regulator [Bacilli bacterium]|nr:helix-turn-helix transcriptional regulator [Bacilli bacterium]
MKLIGKRIKEVRVREGLTQTEFGKILHIEKSAISHYENSERNIPLDIIVKISEYFNVDANYLLGLNNPIKMKSKEVKLSNEEVEFIMELRKTRTYQNIMINPKNYARLVELKISSYKMKL